MKGDYGAGDAPSGAVYRSVGRTVISPEMGAALDAEVPSVMRAGVVGVRRLYVARGDGEHPEGVIGEFDLLCA
ncbi:hypothetical protein DSM104329_00802 [Capillimicrobium parvum]|uniref:Uncharacterized protein n=1 Tax=Capillimicrobium parvum TaxID=2884022 RepID=A0A9E7BZC5_9ACTN|nr:hypothetical protein DSM104329_00802 [Capillimicrobium parvum]